jgi:hypothetical protein
VVQCVSYVPWSQLVPKPSSLVGKSVNRNFLDSWLTQACSKSNDECCSIHSPLPETVLCVDTLKRQVTVAEQSRHSLKASSETALGGRTW